MVPLFMAGDKQYYYFANQTRKTNDVPLIFICEGPLEFSKFKAGFCGVNESNHRMYNIPLLLKGKLVGYFLRQFLRNPRYINTSFSDSLFAFWSAYFLEHDYTFLYQYVRWDENTINQTLIDEYNWEIDPETPSTWRIGDGTAAFYNYIYYTVAGFTENDTLRCNQVREGSLTRQEALEKVDRENQPRWNSMEWYAHTIGFNLHEAVQVINSIPKHYAK